MIYKELDEFGYHGNAMCPPYFEGWYFKADMETYAFAVIIGIAKNDKDEHAFIQLLDTISKRTRYYRYEMDQVDICHNPFSIRIGNSNFQKHRMILHTEDVQADLTMYAFTDLFTTSYSPTIMGPFSYYAHMQCVHSIISMHHYVRGVFCIDHELYSVNGIGYIEKDRGSSFPKEYIWAQANTCGLKNCCFFLSTAHIPFMQTAFHGCICVLMIHQKQYRFATYYGTRITKTEVRTYADRKEATIELVQFSYRLHILIMQYHAYPLLAPKDGIMEPKVFESLSSEIYVTLYHKDKKLHDLHFTNAGSELRMQCL